MAEQGVVFDTRLADRLVQMLELWERQRGSLRGYPQAQAPAGEVTVARVTSGTADGDGNYPAVVTVRDPDDGSWDDFEPVKVRGANGETLTSGTRYAVKPAGLTAGGDLLLMVVGGVAATAATAAMVKAATDVEASDGYYGGLLVTPAAGGGYTVGSAVWLRGFGAIDGQASSHTRPVEDQYYHAVSAGRNQTIGGDTRAVYLIPDAHGSAYGGWLRTDDTADPGELIHGRKEFQDQVQFAATVELNNNVDFNGTPGDTGTVNVGRLSRLTGAYDARIQLVAHATDAHLRLQGNYDTGAGEYGPVCYGIVPAGDNDPEVVYGVWGTLEDGSTVSGGIITEIGAGSGTSGSGVQTNASRSWMGI